MATSFKNNNWREGPKSTFKPINPNMHGFITKTKKNHGSKKSNDFKKIFNEYTVKKIFEELARDNDFVPIESDKGKIFLKIRDLTKSPTNEKNIKTSLMAIIRSCIDYKNKERNKKRGTLLRSIISQVGKKNSDLKKGYISTDEFIEWVNTEFIHLQKTEDEATFAYTKFLGKVIGLNNPKITLGIMPLVMKGALRLNNYQPLNLVAWSDNPSHEDRLECAKIMLNNVIANPFQRNGHGENPMISADAAAKDYEKWTNGVKENAPARMTVKQAQEFSHYVLEHFPAEKCKTIVNVLMNDVVGGNMKSIPKIAWCIDRNPTTYMEIVTELFNRIVKISDKECKQHYYSIIELWIDDLVKAFNQINAFVHATTKTGSRFIGLRGMKELISNNRYIAQYFKTKYSNGNGMSGPPIDIKKFYSIMYWMATNYPVPKVKVIGGLIGCLMRRRCSEDTIGKVIIDMIRNRDTRAFNMIRHNGRVPPSIRKEVNTIIADKMYSPMIYYSLEGLIRDCGKEEGTPTGASRDKRCMDRLAITSPYVFDSDEPPYMLGSKIGNQIKKILDDVGFSF